MEEQTTDFEYDYSENIITEKEAEETFKLQKEFLESYAKSRDTMPVEEWLPLELKKHLPKRKKADLQAMSDEIIKTLNLTEGVKKSQQEAIENGRSKESWLASTLMQSTSQMSAKESAKYLQGLDDAIQRANTEMYEAVMTKGSNYKIPNQNPNLDGFIAEQHHVNSSDRRHTVLLVIH